MLSTLCTSYIIDIYRILSELNAGPGTLIFRITLLSFGAIVILPAMIISCKSSALIANKSSKRKIKCIAFIFVICLIAVALNLMLSTNTGNRIVITYAILSIGMSLICLTMVYEPDIDISNNNNMNNKSPIGHSRSPSNLAKRIRSRSKSDPQSQNALSVFQNVWKNKKLFQLFASHCAKEYSMYVQNKMFLIMINK